MSARWVIGVDEAGRGPLAGPVCAGAVVLNPQRPIPGLADSKKLSEKKRQHLAPLIKEEAFAWGIGWASVEEIDQMNILQATFLAMSRAVTECLSLLASPMSSLPAHEPPDVFVDVMVQVDGNQSPAAFNGPWHWPYQTQTIIKGDESVPAISAASILAKTARDAAMMQLHEHYPAYGFAQHAGYGTARHLACLIEHGPSPVHRKSFAPVARLLNPTAKA
jgi:ribonuclease HII